MTALERADTWVCEPLADLTLDVGPVDVPGGALLRAPDRQPTLEPLAEVLRRRAEHPGGLGERDQLVLVHGRAS